MDFSLSDEQRMLRDLFRQFAEQEVAKVAEEADKSEALPVALLQQAAAQGFFGATIPEEHGGAALDWLSFTLLIEELAKACLSTALTVGLHVARTAMAVLDAGTDAQRQQYLPPMAAGEAIGAFAFTEPEAGSDLTHLQTVAEGDGDSYVINGTKCWVANAGLAGLFVVFAATKPEAGENGISAFVVSSDNPGVLVGYREPTLGLRGLGVYTVYFQDCVVPLADRLGAENEGWIIGRRAEDRARLMIGASALGAAQAVLESGIRFSVERAQFGGPIANKQAIQNFIAETAVEIEALRRMVHFTAWQADTGQEFGHDAAMLKSFAARVATDAADRMVQTHGGYGYMEDYPVARVYRDVRALRILGGTDEIQKASVAREVYRQHDFGG